MCLNRQLSDPWDTIEKCTWFRFSPRLWQGHAKIRFWLSFKFWWFESYLNYWPNPCRKTIFHLNWNVCWFDQKAVKQQCIVFAPNYRKSPEFPFPCSQLDALDTALYVFENCENYNIDSQKIILAGDSAGGMLAVNCWYRLHRGSTDFSPLAISLLNPCLGYRGDSPR